MNIKPDADWRLVTSFKVYLVDVVGFGKSDLPEHPLNSDDFGNFLEQFVNKLEIKNPLLMLLLLQATQSHLLSKILLYMFP